jgi:hypothetical protein
LLAVVKYNKWDEKKEQIHNLREQFSEFIVQIERRDDLISCWKQDNFWAGTSIKEKDKLWKEEMTRLDNEIPVLIEKKQSLVCNYEQIMDKVEVDMLRLRERRIDKHIKERQISLLEDELHLKQNEHIMQFEHKKQELINKKILEMINSDNCGSKYLVYDFHQMGRIVKGKNPESSSSILSKMKIISPNNNTLVTIPDTESIDEGEPDV